MRDERRKREIEIILALCLIALPLAVFWNVQAHDFIHLDDPQYITENPRIRQGVTLDGLSWALTSTYAFNWHPLTWVSHMLDVELYGLNPAGHHLNNLLLHTANTLLLFLLLKTITGAPWRSAATAALFALHPLHVESVAWASERKDVLSAFFFLLTLRSYAGFVEHRGRGRYLLCLLFFALGLMSKPMVVTLPFVLLLLDYWPLGRFRDPKTSFPSSSALPRLVREKIPFFLLAAASSVMALVAQKTGGAVIPLETVSLAGRVSNALLSYATYLWKTLCPYPLAVFYPFHPDAIPLWKVPAAGLVLAGITASAFCLRRTRPYLWMGWLWYLGTLVPVIGLVQVGSQAMADRYTYIPLIGIFLGTVWGVGELTAPKTRKTKAWVALLTGCTLLGCAMLTRIQLGHWQNSLSLFRHTLHVSPGNPVTHYNMALALTARSDALEEARFHYEAVLRMRPDHDMAHNNLGNLLARQGRHPQAASHYRRALRIDPKNEKAHTNLGVVLSRMGHDEEALFHHREAVRIRPEFKAARRNAALLLAHLGRHEEARAHLEELLRVDPRDAEAHFHLGLVHLSMEDPGAARRQHGRLKTLSPELAAGLLVRIQKKLGPSPGGDGVSGRAPVPGQ